MEFRIIFSPEAREDFKDLAAYHRAAVRDAINRHLKHEPEKESKSRIKRLRGVEKPQYRLRVGKIRIFYDVHGHDVEILAIVDKTHATDWLRKRGI